MKPLYKIAAIALPLTVAGAVFAGEPIALTETQMDGVSAGGAALAQATAAGFGGTVLVQTATLADVRVLESFSSELTSINLLQSTAAATAGVSAN